MTLSITETAGLLEILASEQPALLSPVLATLGNCRGVIAFATDCHIEIADVEPISARSARQLTQLEPRGRRWTDPQEVVGHANVIALRWFAHARRRRVQAARSRRIHALEHRLTRAAALARARAQVNEFLTGPLKPVDPAWLNDFLRRPGPPRDRAQPIDPLARPGTGSR